MGNLTLLLFIALAAPLSLFLIIFNGQARKIIAFLMLGFVMCLLSGEINGLLYKNFNADLFYSTANIFPIVEEILKALPIIFYVFLYNPDKKDITMCSLIIGVGFAILENSYILAQEAETADLLLTLFRGFGAGMMHAVCTLMVGFGLTFVKEDKRLALCGTFALLSLAIMYHSTYNCIVSSNHPLFGIILPSITFIPLLIVFKKKRTAL